MNKNYILLRKEHISENLFEYFVKRIEFEKLYQRSLLRKFIEYI